MAVAAGFKVSLRAGPFEEGAGCSLDDFFFMVSPVKIRFPMAYRKVGCEA